MENPVLTPNSVNYLQPTVVYNQLTNNPDNLTLSTAVSAATDTPNIRTDGSGNAWLQGSLNITTASPAANMLLATLPLRLQPQRNYTFPVSVLRSGVYEPNAIGIASTGSAITGVTVDTAGSYATLPTVSLTGPGTGATLALDMKAVTVTPVAAGAGYAPANTITAAGGTSTSAFIATVVTTQLIVAVVNAPGTGYAPTNTITTAGGTASVPAVLTVATTQVVSATVAAGGTGGTAGTQTVTGTTGTGTPFQASVTVSGGGAITAVLSISVGGSYTVNPTAPATEPVTGASLTGAELNVILGVNTVTVANAGVYTANATAFTQASTSGTGTGATFNTLSFGVNTATVSTPGSYTVLPTSPVAQGSTSGGGTGVTLTTLWGLLSVTVSAGGAGYTSASSFQLNGGGGTGGGTGTLVLGASSVGQITLLTAPNQNDVVVLDSPAFLVLAPNE